MLEWCADILHEKRSGVTHASFPAALAHWSIYKKGQARVQGYSAQLLIRSVDSDTCRLEVVVKGGAPHR